ncbi:MAG: hypothetical protein JWQ43_3323 [Glaciihabitans sp.]|nr:hypothetical protein [Glaciihabitans sp.]
MSSSPRLDKNLTVAARNWAASPGVRARVLLAAKAALAAAVAWVIAPYLPGVADAYPWYAPLGALIAMYPTVAGSVRTAVQTLIGLAIGVALGGAVVLFLPPGVGTVALVVGVGVLLSSFRRLGAGQEIIPTAAIIVLIVGGQEADMLSIGYLVQTTAGVTVGLAVNWLILPPLAVQAAVSHLSEFRSLLTRHLRDVGAALREDWPPIHENWAKQSLTFATTLATVRDAVREADDSRKGNPRAKRQSRKAHDDYDDLTALETTTFHVRDMSEVLAGSIWPGKIDLELASDLRAPLATAIDLVADVLDRWEDDDARREALGAAEKHLDGMRSGPTGLHPSATTWISPAAIAVTDLSRMLVVLRGRDDMAATSYGSASGLPHAS